MKVVAIDLEQLMKNGRWPILIKALKKLKQDVESNSSVPKVFDLDKLSIDEEGGRLVIKHDE